MGDLLIVLGVVIILAMIWLMASPLWAGLLGGVVLIWMGVVENADEDRRQSS